MVTINDDLRQKFAKQLMAYFSDININTNWFMRIIVNKDNGWISFATLMTFNRLKRLADNSYDIFVDIVKNLQLDTDFLEIDVINERVRRNPNRPVRPKTDEWIREFNERTVHLAGFPTAAEAESVTFDQLMQWSQTYGTVEWLDMRYRRSTMTSHNDNNKQFKGCIFVTYETKAMADSLLGQEVVKYGDNNKLMKENKLQYYRRKREFMSKTKSKKTDDQVINKLAIKEMDINTDNRNSVYIPKNTSVLMLKKVPKQLSYQSIRNYFYKLCGHYQRENRCVKYVLKIGQKNVCYVRFHGEHLARAVLDINRITVDKDTDQKLVIDGHQVVAEVLHGEDKQRFWRLNNKRIVSLKNKTHNYRRDMSDYQMTSLETSFVMKRVDRQLDLMKQSLPESVLVIGLCGTNGKHRLKDKKQYAREKRLIDKLNRLATVSSNGYWNSYLYVQFAGRRMARNVLAKYRVDDAEPMADFDNNVFYKMRVNRSGRESGDDSSGEVVYARVMTGSAEQQFVEWTDRNRETIVRQRLIKRELKRFRRCLRR
ncbi:la protein homolog [Oppia nitens]|uniref:la protein homolog n=1 Tax=Oppia nitens TaxID=1686743 RepID=UPI0023D9B90E|nr:la protein homolog [Oppia nitens]